MIVDIPRIGGATAQGIGSVRGIEKPVTLLTVCPLDPQNAEGR